MSKEIIKITQLEEQMKEVNKNLARTDAKIDKLEKSMIKEFDSLHEELSCYVRKEEFATVKNIVYGMVGMILTAFLSGVIYLVFK
jgi:molecular chaperone GrpE (heat shock protein)